MKNDLRINILGTDFTISTGEEKEYLEKLLGKYRQTIENVQRISGLKDPLKIAVLTGFLLCDDLEKAGSGPAKKEDSSEAEQLTLGMISRLNEVVQDTQASGAIDAPVVSVIPKAEPEAEPEAEPAVAEPDTGVSGSPDGAFTSNGASITGGALYRLKNTIKHYDWGSPEWLPALLGRKNPGRIPWAELWMGVNSAGPSRIAGAKAADDGDESAGAAALPLLSELIEQNAEAFLGKKTAAGCAALPFLFKVEAIAKPLSIQAHPNRGQAREGFDRENREGIPLDAPNRNYRDSGHKPEIICALSPFAALCGFRKAAEIIALFEILCLCCEGSLQDSLESLVTALKREDGNPHKNFLAALFGMQNSVYEALGSFIRKYRSLLERDFSEYRGEWELCAYLAGLYPADPGIMAPLYLNIIELSPGEAIYLPAGEFHAYIHGMGIELMADSDNVLRGGLTSKYVDREELFRILNFREYRPEILKGPGSAASWFSYPAPAEEFVLSVIQSGGKDIPYHRAGPSIVLVTEGNAFAAGMNLPKGESVFIPAGTDLVFSGAFTAYAAGINADFY